jgi:hypothetical protein
MVPDFQTKYKLQVVSNRELRKIGCPKREEISEKLRTFHKKKLHGLYKLYNIVIILKVTVQFNCFFFSYFTQIL